MVYGARPESTVRPATDGRHFPDLIFVPNPCTRGGTCSGFLYRERNLRKSSAISVIGPAAARIVTHIGPCFTLSRPYFLAIGLASELLGGILDGSSPAWSVLVPGFRTLVPPTARPKRLPPSRGRELKNHQARGDTTNTDITLFCEGNHSQKCWVPALSCFDRRIRYV